MKQNLKEFNRETDKFFTKDPGAYYFNNKGEARPHSVHGGSRYRFEKAKTEAEKAVKPIEEIIDLVNDFFAIIGIAKVENPRMNPQNINYEKIMVEHQLENKRDIIWMKFTDDGYLGVIAQRNDINFDIPDSADECDKKNGKNWSYNTSGILIHSLHKQWDKTFVLVFPLHREGCIYSRHDIETAVGNYLIEKGVPILDYYSHNY